MGVLDLADATFAGAGEGVGLVARKISLSNRFSGRPPQLSATNWWVWRPAEIMQAARDQFLAGAGLAFDQHVGRGVGDIGNQFAQVLHRWRAADDATFQRVALGQLPT